MKIVLLLAALLLAGLVVSVQRRKRLAKDEAAAASARARVRRSRIPVVSNNLKGVTATQTIEPYRSPADQAQRDDDERAA